MQDAQVLKAFMAWFHLVASDDEGSAQGLSLRRESRSQPCRIEALEEF